MAGAGFMAAVLSFSDVWIKDLHRMTVLKWLVLAAVLPARAEIRPEEPLAVEADDDDDEDEADE
jgi:hypothetical protein